MGMNETGDPMGAGWRGAGLSGALLTSEVPLQASALHSPFILLVCTAVLSEPVEDGLLSEGDDVMTTSAAGSPPQASHLSSSSPFQGRRSPQPLCPSPSSSPSSSSSQRWPLLPFRLRLTVERIDLLTSSTSHAAGSGGAPPVCPPPPSGLAPSPSSAAGGAGAFGPPAGPQGTVPARFKRCVLLHDRKRFSHNRLLGVEVDSPTGANPGLPLWEWSPRGAVGRLPREEGPPRPGFDVVIDARPFVHHASQFYAPPV
ncbi:unnamed protein product [Boreogadus saida]